MTLQASDLFYVQRAGQGYKLSYSNLGANYTLPTASSSTLGGIKVGTNLSINAGTGVLSANLPGALRYKGVLNLTDSADVPASPVIGDVWINTTAGNIDPGFTGLSGRGSTGEMILWDGSKWDVVGLGAANGVVSITGTAPVTIAGTAAIPVVSVADATATTKGIVQLADAAAITAGTIGRIVDAKQLKAVADQVAAAAAGGLSGITADDGISVSTSSPGSATSPAVKIDISSLPSLP